MSTLVDISASEGCQLQRHGKHKVTSSSIRLQQHGLEAREHYNSRWIWEIDVVINLFFLVPPHHGRYSPRETHELLSWNKDSSS